MTGHVIRLVRDRGFGFIRDEEGNEYFFHRSGCVDGTTFEQLYEQVPVTFEEEPSPKGPRVSYVRVQSS